MNVIFHLVEHGGPEWEKAVELRELILRRPLGSTFSPEELLEEKKHHHFVGLTGDQVVATAVLVPESNRFKMQRVAVLENLQGKQLGHQLMTSCEDFARSKNIYQIYCHARDTAVGFYAKNGYLPEGDYFNEDGIPHLKMVKVL